MFTKTRRYLIELGIALAIYTALIFASNWIHHSFQPEGVLKFVNATSPMLGVVAMAIAILRHVRRLDEMKQRETLEALAFAFTASAFGFFAWGFAETVGAPKLPTFATWPIMAGLWVIGGFIAHRRYR